MSDELGVLSRDGPAVHAPDKITLTPAGHVAAGDAGRGLADDEMAALCECKRFFNGMTDEQSLLYTCLVHPDMVASTQEHRGLLLRAGDIVMGW